MVRIRLRRVGAKKQPSYRIVVIKSEAPATGRPIETIGHFNPRTEPETIVVKEDRALYWLSVGAQPSEAVLRILVKLGIMEKHTQLKMGESVEAADADKHPIEETLARASKDKAATERDEEE